MWHICLSANVQTHWDPALGSWFVTEPTCYSPPGYVLFWQDHICVKSHGQLCQFAVSFWVTCWVFITLVPIHFFCFDSLFLLCISSRGCVKYDKFQFPCNFLFLMWLSLLMLCPIMGPFIVRVLCFPSPILAPCLILCGRCIFPCRNSRMLHSCCIRWPFSYPIRWLPYIWTIVLLKFICLIKVVQVPFYFTD